MTTKSCGNRVLLYNETYTTEVPNMIYTFTPNFIPGLLWNDYGVILGWCIYSVAAKRALFMLIAATAMTSGSSNHIPLCTSLEVVSQPPSAIRQSSSSSTPSVSSTSIVLKNVVSPPITPVGKSTAIVQHKIVVEQQLHYFLTREMLAAVTSLACVGAVAITHAVKVYKLRRRKCRCKLCKGDYKIIRSLGQGGFGVVYLANRRTRGSPVVSQFFTSRYNLSDDKLKSNLVVLKKIPVDDVTEADSMALEGRRLFPLVHPFMVQYQDDFIHMEYSGSVVVQDTKCFCIVIMEYCSGGDIKQLIEKEWETLTESKIRKWIYQIGKALQFLHEKGIIHRDIKSANVFLSTGGVARLGDFGLSRLVAPKRKDTELKKSFNGVERFKKDKRKVQIKTLQEEKSANIRLRHTSFLLMENQNTMNQITEDSGDMSHVGTDCYMAPELSNSLCYGRPSDVWGLGCVLFELCSGIFMWEVDIQGNSKIGSYHSSSRLTLGKASIHDHNIPIELINRLVSTVISKRTKRLLQQMLHPDPARRITLPNLLKKKWLRNCSDLFPGGRRLPTKELTLSRASDTGISYNLNKRNDTPSSLQGTLSQLSPCTDSLLPEQPGKTLSKPLTQHFTYKQIVKSRQKRGKNEYRKL